MSGEKKAVSKKSLSEKAYQALKERILVDRFAEGEPLCEQSLAEALGMSRTPVRVAIRRLEEEGFLTVVPRRGAFVSSLSVQDYRDVNDLRSVLEPLALETSIDRIPAEALAHQREIWSLIASDLKNGWTVDRSELIARDEEFHELIIGYCQNRRLQGVMKVLRRQIVPIRLASWTQPEFFLESAQEHIQLIDFIERRNLSAAQKLIKSHILLNRNYIRSFVGKRSTLSSLNGGQGE